MLSRHFHHVALLGLFAFSLTVTAGIADFSSVSGRVTSFDATTVTLTHRGSNIQVPRTAIPKYYKVRPGVWVVAYLKTKGLAPQYSKSK